MNLNKIGGTLVLPLPKETILDDFISLANILADTGRAIISKLLAGSGQAQPSFGSWGTGSGTSSHSDTTLFTEMYSTFNNGTGNQRVSATLSQVTTAQSNDTYQALFTLTSTTSQTITNVGIFDAVGTSGSLSSAPSGGNLFLKSDFSGLALNASDSLQCTMKLQFN